MGVGFRRRAQVRQEPFRFLTALGREQIDISPPDQAFVVDTEFALVSVIDEGQDAVRQVTADQFGLGFDQGAIQILACLKRQSHRFAPMDDERGDPYGEHGEAPVGQYQFRRRAARWRMKVTEDGEDGGRSGKYKHRAADLSLPGQQDDGDIENPACEAERYGEIDREHSRRQGGDEHGHADVPVGECSSRHGTSSATGALFTRVEPLRPAAMASAAQAGWYRPNGNRSSHNGINRSWRASDGAGNRETRCGFASAPEYYLGWIRLTNPSRHGSGAFAERRGGKASSIPRGSGSRTPENRPRTASCSRSRPAR